MSGITMAPACGGGGGPQADVQAATYAYSDFASTSFTTYIKFAADGKVYTGEDTDDSGLPYWYPYHYFWLTSGSASDCVINVAPTSGSFTTGSINTDLNLGTDRTWTRRSTGVLQSVTATFTIKKAVGGDTLDSASITCSADRL